MANFLSVNSVNSGVSEAALAEFAKTYMSILLVIVGIYVIAAYCIKSIGMYKIAQSRNFNNAYLAWFPFVRHYLFGKVSDDINRSKNVQSSGRVILLILSILNCIFVLALIMFMFVSLGEIAAASSYATPSSSYWTLFAQTKTIPFLAIIGIMFMVNLLFNIFYCVYANNIFKDYIPKLSTLMCIILVLNLFTLGDRLVDSIIFLSISANQPKSLKNNE